MQPFQTVSEKLRVVQSFAKLQGVGLVPERQSGGLLPSSRFQLILID
jgi:hypothetical protein